MSFIWYIIIGIVAGFLAGKIMRGGGFGLVINLLLGILGGVLGGWVFALFGLAASGLIGRPEASHYFRKNMYVFPEKHVRLFQKTRTCFQELI